MTSDLYELLGVKKTADLKTIRTAYRKKAKKAHPDMKGGDVRVFAALKKAHDILTDTARRSKYDATGDDSEAVPDNSMSQVVGLLAQTLGKVLDTIERKMGNPTEYELVNDMKIMLGGELDAIQRRKKTVEEQKKKAEKLLGRFGVKNGVNYLDGIVNSMVSSFGQQIRHAEDQEAPVKKALDILAVSSFKSDYGGAKNTHRYGSAFSLADLMGQALNGK